MSEPKPDLEQCAIMEELGRLDPTFDKNQPVYLLSPAYLEEIGEDDYSLIKIQGVRDDVFVPTSEAIRRRLNEGPNKFCRVVAYHTQDRKLKFELVKVDGPDSRGD